MRGRLDGRYENYNAQKELLERGFNEQGVKNCTWVSGIDTIRYKKGNIFIQDTTKPAFKKRQIKKKQTKSK